MLWTASARTSKSPDRVPPGPRAQRKGEPMGISLNHPAQGLVGWSSSVDTNWTTLETSYLARQQSDTSVVAVTGTTAETVLMANTTLPANALAVGTVVPVWAAGLISV